MQKRSTLLCLAFLLLVNTAFSAPLSKQEKARRFLENYATSSGNVPLVLGDLGLFVHVDFTNHADQASDSDDNTDDYGSMVLALYTDQTFFGRTCQGFQDFCAKGNFSAICNNTLGQAVNVTFPFFETSGAPIGPQIFLDYDHWSLKTPAILSTSCHGYYDVGGYGLVGMGISSDSWSNYLGKTPNFAVQVAKNLSNGSFAFNIDLNNAKSSSASAILPADNLWHVTGVSSIEINDNSIPTTSSLIFDLGSDFIGFPQALHQQVLSQIEKNAAVGGCSIGDDFRPICNFSGDIRNLPTITVKVGSQEIDISPEIYVVQTQDNNYFYYDPITLKLKVLSTNETQGMQVTSSYENYIILGYPAMSYYYTVFEAGHPQGGSVTLYLSNEYSSASDMTWLFILAGVVGILLIGAIFYFYDKKYRKKIVVEDPLLGTQEIVKAKTVRRLH